MLPLVRQCGAVARRAGNNALAFDHAILGSAEELLLTSTLLSVVDKIASSFLPSTSELMSPWIRIRRVSRSPFFFPGPDNHTSTTIQRCCIFLYAQTRGRHSIHLGRQAAVHVDAGHQAKNTGANSV